MTAAVIWLVVWIILAVVGSRLVLIGVGGGGAFVAAATDRLWLAGASLIAAWILAMGWFIFAAIQVILQVVSIIELLT